MTSEDYHRPPVVAIELRAHRAAIWRFRIVVGAMFAGLALIIVWVTHAIVSNTDGSGTVGGLHHVTLLATLLR